MNSIRIGYLFTFTALTSAFAHAGNPACQQALSDLNNTQRLVRAYDVHDAGTCVNAAIGNTANCLSGNTEVDRSCPAPYVAPEPEPSPAPSEGGGSE